MEPTYTIENYKPSVVCGLDLSINSTGLCLMSADDTMTVSIRNTPSVPFYEKIKSTVDSLRGYLYRSLHLTESAVFIEDYAFGFGSGKNTSNLTQLAELAGIVKVYLHDRSIPTFLVSPTVLKKWVTGKGTAKKDEMRLHLFKKHRVEFTTTDECDAYGLADMGSCLLGTPTNHSRDVLTKTEIDILSSYMKGKVNRIF